MITRRDERKMALKFKNILKRKTKDMKKVW
jgi:hypothetical protein